MELEFEIYDKNRVLIGKTTLANNYTLEHYKSYFSPDGKMDFEFIPTDKNYEWGRFNFHNKNNKIDESFSPIKITIEHYELLKRNQNPKNPFDYSSEWIPF